jgi:hypothetical protein
MLNDQGTGPVRATRVAALALALLAPGAAAAAASACPIRDSFGDFLALADRVKALSPTEQLDAFHGSFLGANLALYTPEAVGLTPGSALDARAVKTISAVTVSPAAAQSHAALLAVLPGVETRFAAAFPDFRCVFPIYIAPTFGMLDGAGRMVAGEPALVLGPDTIARVERHAQLPVLISHELFHRYHFQAAGFSDDPGDRQAIWRALWAEGLATYVSGRLNRDHPMADVLMSGDLAARAPALTARIAQGVAPQLDAIDHDTYATYFEGGVAAADRQGLPYRSGYYLGYRVAEILARRHSLDELAHLQGPALRAEIGAAVAELAKGA